MKAEFGFKEQDEASNTFTSSYVFECSSLHSAKIRASRTPLGGPGRWKLMYDCGETVCVVKEGKPKRFLVVTKPACSPRASL